MVYRASDTVDLGVYVLPKIGNIFIFLFIFVLIGFSVVFASESLGPNFSVTIENPVEKSTSITNSILVNFTVNNNNNSVQPNSVEISSYLDGQFYSNPELGPGLGQYGVLGAQGGFVLTNLTEGEHTIEIRVKISGFILGEGNYDRDLDSAVTHFSIDTNQQPTKVTQKPTLLSSLAIYVGAAIAAVIMSALALLLFSKKIKPILSK
jgi:hypothetical protein